MDIDNGQLTLENLMIAAPCDVEWDDMAGDDRVRRCGDCRLNVYNVTSLTSKEVEELLQTSAANGTRLCMQLYRRADGTVITADCPQGLKKIRALTGRLWRWAAAALAVIVGGGAAMAQDKAKTPTMPLDANGQPMYRTAGMVCPPTAKKKSGEAETKKPADQLKSSGSGETKASEDTKSGTAESEETHKGKAHYTAFNLYKEGQQYEKSGTWDKAVEVYQQALTLMAKQKHDPKFHLKIETALSRAKAKAGMNQ